MKMLIMVSCEENHLPNNVFSEEIQYPEEDRKLLEQFPERNSIIYNNLEF